MDLTSNCHVRGKLDMQRFGSFKVPVILTRVPVEWKRRMRLWSSEQLPTSFWCFCNKNKCFINSDIFQANQHYLTAGEEDKKGQSFSQQKKMILKLFSTGCLKKVLPFDKKSNNSRLFCCSKIF